MSKSKKDVAAESDAVDVPFTESTDAGIVITPVDITSTPTEEAKLDAEAAEWEDVFFKNVSVEMSGKIGQGIALRNLFKLRRYEKRFGSTKVYLEQHLRISQADAYRRVDMADVAKLLEAAEVPLPTNESQFRALARLKKKPALMIAILSKARESNSEPTALEIEVAKNSLLAAGGPKPKALPPTMPTKPTPNDSPIGETLTPPNLSPIGETSKAPLKLGPTRFEISNDPEQAGKNVSAFFSFKQWLAVKKWGDAQYKAQAKAAKTLAKVNENAALGKEQQPNQYSTGIDYKALKVEIAKYLAEHPHDSQSAVAEHFSTPARKCSRHIVRAVLKALAGGAA